MADNGMPRLPMAASSNVGMNMSMSTVSVSKTSEKLSDMVITDSTTLSQNASEETDVQSQASHSKSTAGARTRSLASGQHTASVKRDGASSRERMLDMQRIQLAMQLGDERKSSKDLEARLVDLQQELASLTAKHEASEAECAKLRNEIDSTTQQLASQTAGATEQDNKMQEKIRDLESKLEEANKKLEESIWLSSTLQDAYDEAVVNYRQQNDRVHKLDEELKLSRTNMDNLNIKYVKLQEMYDKDVKNTLLSMEESHKSREDSLQQRLTRKGREMKDLKQELDTLRSACKDAFSEKEAAEKKLRTQTKEEKAKTQKLQKSLDELQKSTMPFAQSIVIGVDVSGSLSHFLHRIKQIYRDVLHTIKMNNRDAKVAVVIHGCNVLPTPSPLEAISETTFQMVDSISGTGGNEDYTYCLNQAYEILTKDIDGKKVVLLIGDGNAMCSGGIASLLDICGKLKSAKILAHSIVAEGGPRPHITWGVDRFSGVSTEVETISNATGGRVESEDAYLSALEEILRHEREEHFRH